MLPNNAFVKKDSNLEIPSRKGHDSVKSYSILEISRWKLLSKRLSQICLIHLLKLAGTNILYDHNKMG